MAYILLRSTSRFSAYRSGVRELYACSTHKDGSEARLSTSYRLCGSGSSRHRRSQNEKEETWRTVYFAGIKPQTTPSLSYLYHPNLHPVDLHILRTFHSASQCYKDERVVEKSVKALKSELEKSKDKAENAAPTSAAPEPGKTVQVVGGYWATKWMSVRVKWAEMREYGVLLYIWEGTKHMFWHYVNGFRLFWTDLKICLPLLMRYITKGRSSLKRREYKQLTRTLADLVRMFPLIPMLVIPLGEIFIPFYISIGMMPSTFLEKKDVDKTNRMKLQRKIEYGAMLAESLKDVPLQTKKKEEVSNLKDFTDFMKRVKSTEIMPSTEEIMKFSRLFEDELTVDDLSTVQLQSLCKILGIGFFSEIPNKRILRFQIGMKLRELEVDDKLIQKEGIDSLAVWELQEANRKRGMRAIGVSEERLKLQLQQWLDLHLKEEVPTTLLILSRIMFLEEKLSPAEQLKQALSTLSESTVDKVMVSTAELMGESVDKATKIRMLKEEQKAIKTEKKQEREEEKEMLKKQKDLAEAEAKKAAEAEAQQLAEAELLRQTEALKADPLLKVDVAEPAVDTVKTEEQVKELVDVPPKEDIAKPIIDAAPVHLDTAEPIEVKKVEEVTEVKKEEEVEDHITSKDMGDIEQAIEELSMHTKYEFEDVKEDLQEYVEDVEDIHSLMVAKSMPDEMKESRGAVYLRKQLDKYLGDLEQKIDVLHEKKVLEQSTLEKQEVELKYDLEGKREQLLESISEKKRVLININEVLLGLRRLQKVPDDIRMQKVLEVLDTDQDGLIDISDVLKVTELLGRENLKMDKTQVSSMMELLRKEEEMKVKEKIERSKNKVETVGDTTGSQTTAGESTITDSVIDGAKSEKDSADSKPGEVGTKDTKNNTGQKHTTEQSNQTGKNIDDSAKSVDDIDSAKTLNDSADVKTLNDSIDVKNNVKTDIDSQNKGPDVSSKPS